jgi:hypothetical protein
MLEPKGQEVDLFVVYKMQLVVIAATYVELVAAAELEGYSFSE